MGIKVFHRRHAKLTTVFEVSNLFYDLQDVRPCSSALNDCSVCAEINVKGELKPEISLLHMKVVTLTQARSNVFL